MNTDNINFDDFVASSSSFHKKYGNVYISEAQYNVLIKYGFVVDKYNNISELLYDIEEYLNDSGEFLDDLDLVSQEIAEYNYYNNTNK